MRNWRIKFALLLAALFLSGALRAEPGPQPGQMMPDFTLGDQYRRKAPLSSLTKLRPAVVYFFSDECTYCLELVPRLPESLRRWRAAGVATVGVHFRGGPRDTPPTVRKYGLPGVVLGDPGGLVCDSLGVVEFTVFVLDREGKIRYRGPSGEFEEEAVAAALKQ